MVSHVSKDDSYLLDLFRSRSQIDGELLNRVSDSVTQNRIAESQDNPPFVSGLEAKITAKFQGILSSMVSLPSNKTKFSSFREAVFAYEADWKTLSQGRKDWTRLCEAVISIETIFGENKLHASVNESETIFRESIANIVIAMAKQMAHQLAILTDAMVLGTIVWHGKSAFQYTFLIHK